MDKTLIAKVSDFGDKTMLGIKTDLINVVLFLHEDGKITALEDRCSHADVRLSRGTFEDGEVQCPAHGARFDVCTGEHRCMPAVSPVRVLEVERSGDEIYLISI